MLTFIIALIFLAIALLAVVMQKTYLYLPERELRRQANNNDALAAVLWRAVGYGAALRMLLWLFVIVGTGVGFVLLSSVAPTVLAIIAVGLLLLLAFAWLPNTRLTSLGGRLTVLFTPPLVWLLRHILPVLEFVQRYLRRYVAAGHTGLFQREDLQELLDMQKLQPDNRISDEELDMARAALSFGTHRVRDILVPRKKAVTVAASDAINPLLIDELHKSQHARFPVTGDKPSDIVGTLYLHDVAAISQGRGAKGKIADVMQHDVYYVHESDSLADALHTFYQTKHQLFVVINSFEEYVGIITLEDILRQLIGQPTIQSLDQPDSRAEVAARHPRKKPVKRTKKEPEAITDNIEPTAEDPQKLTEESSEVVE